MFHDHDVGTLFFIKFFLNKKLSSVKGSFERRFKSLKKKTFLLLGWYSVVVHLKIHRFIKFVRYELLELDTQTFYRA